VCVQEWLQTPIGKNWLQIQGGRVWLQTPRLSMAVNSRSVFLVEFLDTAQALTSSPSSQIPSFSHNESIQELAGFLDISSFPGVDAPKSHFCISASSKHGDHPRYQRLCEFHERSTGTKPINFRRPHLCMPTLGHASLASCKYIRQYTQAHIQGFLESSLPLPAQKAVVLEGPTTLPRYTL